MNFGKQASSIVAALFVLLVLGKAVTMGQAVVPSTDAVIQPTEQLAIPPAQVRNWEQMEADAASKEFAPVSPALEIPFRPTIENAAYGTYKLKAAQTKSSAPMLKSAAPLALSKTTATINFAGVDRITAGNFNVPDTHGAIGLNHFVEITNSHLDIYAKAAPNARVGSLALSAFFGYTSQTLYDPRVIYDQNDDRWVMSSVARFESSTLQRFFFAVSSTSDPLGGYYIYQVNVSDGSGGFWDFPQLGLDRNALIFTANVFSSAGTFIDARMFTVAKSLVYNGQSQTLTPYLFTGLVGTLSPPLVLDESPNTFLVAAQANDSKVTLYTLTNSGGNPPTLSTPATIPVAAYGIPANAPQPGTINTLDTSDCRFVNAGTQIGNSLFQVHTIDDGGLAKCKFYEFDTLNKQLIQSGTFGRSSTSFDFNASIAANRNKDVFVTWSSTDVSNNVNAEVRFSGRLHTDTLGVIPSPGSLLYGSNSYYWGDITTWAQRWGDYSAVSLDPADPKGLTAWIVNETILSTTSWGSRIGRINFLQPDVKSLPAMYFLLLSD